MNRQENLSDRLSNRFSIINWFPGYEKQWLSSDLVAGATLAAFTIPEAIAHANLAGLPPQAGLYACIAPPLLYTLFGSSRQLAVAPTSAVSILVAAALGGLTVHSPAQYAALAGMIAIIVGMIALFAYVLRLGVLVNFISESVLVGFSSGAALFIASTQLGKLFGIPGGHGQFIERIGYLAQHIGEANPWALALGILVLVILTGAEYLVPRLPWTLMIMLGSIGLMNAIDPMVYGISVVGTIPSGLPSITLPLVSLPDVRHILYGSFAIFVLAYVEGMSIARGFATKNGYRVDPNQELLALGVASLGAGFTQAYPPGGSFSGSAVNDRAGAKTQLAGGFSALLIGMVVLFLAGIFGNLPEPVLAAVILVAALRLFKWRQLARLLELSPAEFATAVAAFAGVLGFGILDGVVIGALLSLLLVIRRTSQAQISLLGRVPGQPRFSSMHENPESVPVPGMIVMRVDAGLFYANAKSIKDGIMEVVRESGEPVRAVVLDLALTGHLDLAGAEMLAELNQELRKIGISLRLSKVQASARKMLDRMGITAEIGEDHFHDITLLAAATYLTEEGHSHRMSCDVLPDMVRHVLNMVRQRAGLATGEEQVRLDAIRAKLEEIVSDLENTPCAIP